MKYIAVVESRNDYDTYTNTYEGTFEEIAKNILEDCENALESLDMSLSEIEEEYSCELDFYRKLKRELKKKAVAFDTIANFSFSVDDMETNTLEIKTLD